MIKVLAANYREKSKRYNLESLITLLKAQVENSIEVGWKPEDIYIVSNFDFDFMNVKAVNTKMNDFCWTGSKMFAVKWLLENVDIKDKIIWSGDTDAWQNVWFDPPEIKDIGITTYSTTKFNGGSVFWKSSSKDIVDHVIDVIEKGETREEPTLNKLLKSDYKNRTTILNTTYNVGCSGFFPRIYRAEKPVKVCHLNPTNRIAWETHVLDRNGMGMVSVLPRLELLLRKYYPKLATTLSEEGKKRSLELREENIKKLKL